MAGSIYVMDYEGSFTFPLTPEQMWDTIDFERFESWWPWMRDLQVRGPALEPGSDISFVVVTPLPYKMSLHLFLEDVEEPHFIAGRVTGDLEGPAHLSIAEHQEGCVLTLVWQVEMMQRAMRLAAIVGRPILERAHDWAVDIAIRGFREHVVESGKY